MLPQPALSQFQDVFNNTKSSVAKDAVGARDLGFDSRAGQIGTVSPTARHRCHVS